MSEDVVSNRPVTDQPTNQQVQLHSTADDREINRNSSHYRDYDQADQEFPDRPHRWRLGLPPSTPSA